MREMNEHQEECPWREDSEIRAQTSCLDSDILRECHMEGRCVPGRGVCGSEWKIHESFLGFGGSLTAGALVRRWEGISSIC